MSAPLRPEDFPVFFRELWFPERIHDDRLGAFPWQNDFARRICTADWPRYVAVPTGCGKTACLDACVFALATQASLPAGERTIGRRIFFIVNRRVIVDEAYERAGELCQKLAEAPEGSVAARVADALRSLSGERGAPPLRRVQLRGGIYRDRSWAGSLLQPMIICSTVDQAGSRLLFRGYGVSEQARPIHAALVAQDSVLIVDEAHISRPFIQTLEWVARYRRYEGPGGETVALPFQFLQMTATPPTGTSAAEKVKLTDADYNHPVLKPRLSGAKRAKLKVEEKAKGKTRESNLAAGLVREAREVLTNSKPASLAVMANRVATARLVAEALQKEHGDRVHLLIGRLRPIDREKLTDAIQQRLKTGKGSQDATDDQSPLVVVCTQCLEVGADLDFDALVTEAASLDALRQRFGRLNRAGRDITASAVILLPGDQDIPTDKLDDVKPCDPIYGNAIPRTWQWLRILAADGIVDFGIDAMGRRVEELVKERGEEALFGMLSPTTDAPIMLPAYLDCWVQTNPTPAADPDVAIFLHGPQREIAEVQVCWRADLPESFDQPHWIDTVSLCPPTAAECLPVPLHVFRTWLCQPPKFEDLSSDAEERIGNLENGEPEEPPKIPALIWRGAEGSKGVVRASGIAPGDTVVLRAQDGGWHALGILPDAPADPTLTTDVALSGDLVRTIDVAEEAIAGTRRRAVLRIHPQLWPPPEKGTAAAELLDCATNAERDCSRAHVQELLASILEDQAAGWVLSKPLREIVQHLARASELRIDAYPDHGGIVISSRKVLPAKGLQRFESIEESEADALLEASASQELCDHTRDVLSGIEHTLSHLPLARFQQALNTAAALHDWGKADWRFQAMLRSSSVFAAMASGVVLAKSGSLTSSLAAYRQARDRAGLPRGFRHEMLSVQMAESAAGRSALPQDAMLRALTLHLIATHHGYGRPFAPVIDDESPLEVSLPMKDRSVLVTSEERAEHPAHALDSGFCERFWQMNRRYGWWGVALLESVLRLADQAASARREAAFPEQ